jgi:putative hydrolase of HD superfamily
MDRLDRQLDFIRELDKLKGVLRRTLVTVDDRRENAAEHSWHAALAAVLLHEHALEKPDLCRVVQMLLVHDVVEIDAGDTFCYDHGAAAGQAERERRAAERLFALLPVDQGSALRGLWEEFEAGNTPEARFARVLDRIQPLLQNLATGGRSWRRHGVARGQVLERNRSVAPAAPEIHDRIRALIDQAVSRGLLAP